MDTDTAGLPGGAGGSGPRTLAIDVGGTGLKAAVIDDAARLLTERVRVPTRYPCPPGQLVSALRDLVAGLGSFDRASVGFPGVVRDGLVRTAPHFVTTAGPGSPVDPDLQRAWSQFDLAGALREALGVPVKVANDADLQGAAVVGDSGLELVLTLGTGLGSALYRDGRLACHLELAHHPFQKGRSYNERLGDAALSKVGPAKWSRRVRAALATIDGLLLPDRIYLGGGNAGKVEGGFGEGLEGRVSVVDNTAGIQGGIALWTRDSLQGAP